MAKKDKYGWRETFPRYYKADLELQQKVGTGTIDPKVIEAMQERMQAIATDITPELQKDLAVIEAARSAAHAQPYDGDMHRPAIVRAIMNIKSNGGMFGHLMVSRVAAHILSFLEDVKKLDPDVLEILGAFTKVTSVMLAKDMRDEKSAEGQVLLNEVRNACNRYHEKQQAAIAGKTR